MNLTILHAMILSLLLLSCKQEVYDQYKYQQPEKTGDGIETGTLKEVNMDSTLLIKAINKIHNGDYREVHSILIYKDDKLVLEEYFKGHKYQWNGPGYHGELEEWDRNKMHVIMSCTKSFTSACVGIAIDQGYIDNVHQSIFDYLPEHQHLKTDGKGEISIEHLLTMTSGLKWNEWSSAHGTSSNDIDRIYFECQKNPLACVLERPLEEKPGSDFTYNGGGMIVLGEIVKNASKMDLHEFSMKYLFQPLQINSTDWYKFENGSYAADGSLMVRPRDMLKFGITYLNEGTWKGKRIVSKDWVEKSKLPYRNNTGIKIPIDDSGRNGYAYSWWTNQVSYYGGKAKLFQAGGWGGQEIMVFPDDKMVVVFTGGNYAKKKRNYQILKRYILPSIEKN